MFGYYIVKMIQMDTLDDFDFEIKDISTSSNAKTSGIDELERELQKTIYEDEDRKKKKNNTGFMDIMTNFLGGNDTTNDIGDVGDTNGETKKVQFTLDDTKSNLGNIARNTFANNNDRTNWDGFKSATGLPNGNSFQEPITTSYSSSNYGGDNENLKNAKMKREQNALKKNMLHSLAKWKQKYANEGFKVDTDENSSFEDILDEYTFHKENFKKNKGIKLYKEYLSCFAHTIESANSYVNPFDFNLDGLGDYFSDNSDDFEDIFEELYHKYKMDSLSPELSLIFKIGMGIATVNFMNQRIASGAGNFQSGGGGVDEKGLMKTMFEMMTQNAGGANDKNAMNYLSNLTHQPAINTKFGPPPSPIETKKTNVEQLNQEKYQNSNKVSANARPDIQVAKGMLFEQGGVDLQNNFQTIQQQQLQQPAPQIQVQKLGLNGGQQITRKEISTPTVLQKKEKSTDFDMDIDDLSNISTNSISAFQGKVPRKNGKKNAKKLTDIDISFDL